MSRVDDLLKSVAGIEEARDKLTEWERELEKLLAENASLRAEIEDLKRRLEASGGQDSGSGDVPAGFTTSHGVLWLRGAGGEIECLAYCPTCRLVMTPFPSGYPEHLVCTACKYRAPFHPTELDRIVKEMS